MSETLPSSTAAESASYTCSADSSPTRSNVPEEQEIASANRQGLIASRVRLVGVCTLLSRVLGLARDSAMAALFGNGLLLDAFTIAFRIPNLARVLLGEGALTTALLPALVRTRHQQGTEAMWSLLTAANRSLRNVLLAGVLLGELLLVAWLMWGEPSPSTRLLLQLTAILLPYVVLICLAAQANAALQALGEFLRPALVPVVLNLIWLTCLAGIVLTIIDPTRQMVVMSVCVVLAGGVQLAWPRLSLRSRGYRGQPVTPAAWAEVGGVMRQMIPVVAGLSITQLNTILDSLLAWWLSAPEGQPLTTLWPGGPVCPLVTGTASALYLGQRLYQFPLGVFGVALGTVLFPLLTEHAQRGDKERLRADIGYGIRLVLSIGIPASLGLMLLGQPLAALLFQYGKFTAQDAVLTGQVIAAYGSGVWAYCGLLILQRACYALGDHQSPLWIGLGAVVLNLLLSASLLWWLGGAGIALATAVVAMLQTAATLLILHRKLDGLGWPGLIATSLRVCIAGAIMTLLIIAIQALCRLPWWPWPRGCAVLLPVLLGGGAYLLVVHTLGVTEAWALITRRKTEPDRTVAAQSADPG